MIHFLVGCQTIVIVIIIINDDDEEKEEKSEKNVSSGSFLKQHGSLEAESYV